jgi:hypothetical protein
MKKILWVIGALFVALLVAIISVPLFVNVDQYRPQITAEANKRINGQLELGKLNLSLWGAIKIHAESIRLSVNGFPGELVNTQQFHLEIPFLSVLSGEPQIVAVLTQPKISVVKEADGRINALELVKKDGSAAAPGPAAGSATSNGSVAINTATPGGNAAPGAPAGSAAPAEQNGIVAVTPPAAPAAAPAEPTKVPALLAGAKLGLRIEQGDLSYSDRVAKSDYLVKGLELDVRNLGLGSAMSFNLTAPVQGKTPSMTFAGPVSASGELQPILVGTSVKSAKGDVEVDATKLEINMPGKFKKPASMAFTAKLRVEGNDQETLLRQLELQLHHYRLHGKGRVTLSPMTAKLDFNVDPLRLDQARDFAPMLAEYDLKGILNLSANADITPETIKITGDTKVTEGSFFLKDKLKAPMQFQLQAGFSENHVNITRATLAGPDSELQLVGNVKNFLAPQFSFSVSGKSFNLDKTLVMSEPAKQALLSILIPEAHAAAPAADLNPMLEMNKNPIVAKAAGLLNAQIGKVIVQGAPLEQVQAKADLRNMNLKLLEASLRTFGGSVKATGNFDLKSPSLSFSTRGSASGVSGKEAFKTYFPKYQNTLEGTIGATWDVNGALYPATQRIRNLKGSAKIAAADGALKSVDFQESINSAMAKIPFLKDKKPLQVDNGFKTLTADINFAGGVIKVEPIESQPKGKGFIVKGKSTIQESLEQETFFDVYDPQGLLPRDIQQPGKPALAMRLYGPVNAPKTDYEYTVKKLATNAGKNTLKNVAGKALDKFLGGEKAGGGDKKDALKDAADKLRKKFKF